MKKIAAITMARDDQFFLSRWSAYYGAALGHENLFILLDGLDQEFYAPDINVEKREHLNLSRTAGDKHRISQLSDLAQQLFARGYDIVIGCDSDEFLMVDPATKKSLREYLSDLPTRGAYSGLGLDIGQNMNYESELDKNKPFLEQRRYALLSTRYTKPVVLTRPGILWGSGFHKARGKNFHIDKNLYLLHFGSVDMKMIQDKIRLRGASWTKHIKRRQCETINIITRNKPWGEKAFKFARALQTIFRPIYAWNKPAMLGWKPTVKLPVRFEGTGI